MYDVSDVTSFEKITYWIDEFKDSTVKPELLVVGNKVDSPEAVVTADMAEKFCRLSGNLRSLRCSAKTGENVDLAFETLIETIFNNYIKNNTSSFPIFPLIEMNQPKEIIFDSKENHWDINTSTFDQQLLNRNNFVILIETNENNIFGCFFIHQLIK